MSDSSAPEALVLPRGLIFIASIWLIGCWLLTIGVETPIQPVSASYTPAVRLMLLCVCVGLLIGWPLLRLSQRWTPHPIAATALDLLVLLSLVQVVLWPLRLVTPWSIARTAAIDATVSSWLLIVGAIVAAAIGRRSSGVRQLAMLACVVLCLAGPLFVPLLDDLDADAGVRIIVSPLVAIYALGEGAGNAPSAEQWQRIAALGCAAVIAWTSLLVLLRVRPVTMHDASMTRRATP
ncbi:MAG: hypothetical protein ACYTF9_06365 [Planctomycetota bacterium]|jgi:hypothetical protein